MADKKPQVNRRKSLLGWVEILDAKSNRYYYHNPKSNQISWTHPKLLPENQALYEEYLRQEAAQQNEDGAGDRSSDRKSEPVKPFVWGFAEKLGEVHKNWQERYFVLFTNGTLSYYKGFKPGKNTKELLDLRKGDVKGTLDVTVTRFKTPKGVKGREHMIEIELADRDFQMSFKEKENFLYWKAALQEVGCEFWDPLQPSTKSVYDLKISEKKKEKAVIQRQSSSFMSKTPQEEKPTTDTVVDQNGEAVAIKIIEKSLGKIAIFSQPCEKNSEDYTRLYDLALELTRYKGTSIVAGPCKGTADALLEGGRMVFSDYALDTTSNYRECQNWIFCPGGIESTPQLFDLWAMEKANKDAGVTLNKVIIWNDWKVFVVDAKKNLKMKDDDRFFVVVNEISDVIKTIAG